MEVSNLISHTEKVSCEEAKIELPPNQGPASSPNLILLAKLITNKDIGLAYVRDVVMKAWNPVYPLEVKRMDRDIFMFSFNHEVDAYRAYHRRPWSCKGGHLILKTWNLKVTWQEVDFSLLTFWVQVHGLPVVWNSEDNLRKIGLRLGKVIELDLVGDLGGTWKKFVRICVDIRLGKPLFLGLFLPHPNNTDCWIGLKYEKLIDVCYKCGVVGDEERSCTGTLYQICNPNGARFKAAEPWLR
nr:uncharacterized protein CFP56_06561 [Quercus suber]POF24121.1 uncharacterized protein CFP56_77266 [Quercus suber]